MVPVQKNLKNSAIRVPGGTVVLSEIWGACSVHCLLGKNLHSEGWTMVHLWHLSQAEKYLPLAFSCTRNLNSICGLTINRYILFIKAIWNINFSSNESWNSEHGHAAGFIFTHAKRLAHWPASPLCHSTLKCMDFCQYPSFFLQENTALLIWLMETGLEHFKGKQLAPGNHLILFKTVLKVG